MKQYVKVTPSYLTSAASKLSGYISRFEAGYRELLALMEGMRRWEGMDAQAFTAQVLGFEDDLQNMAALLKEYQKLLEYSASSYIDKQNYLYEMGRTL